MNRIVDNRDFLALLFIGIVTSFVLILVEIQNVRSINDRAYMHQELRETRASLHRLESFVDAIKEAERKRQEARKR